MGIVIVVSMGPRRCSRHPDVVISSPDGMFDGPCGRCEREMADDDDPAEREAYARLLRVAWQDAECGAVVPGVMGATEDAT